MKRTAIKSNYKVGRIRSANLFATRFDPSVSAEQLGNYLSEKLKLNVNVSAVTTKHSTYASFHITCQCPDPSVFLSEDLWPENIFVHWWREQKTQIKQGPVLPEAEMESSLTSQPDNSV